jgi:hypothetical protein
LKCYPLRLQLSHDIVGGSWQERQYGEGAIFLILLESAAQAEEAISALSTH